VGCPSGGTIKSQGRLDGKFMLRRLDVYLQSLEFFATQEIRPPISAASFQPQSQDERDYRNTSNASEP
jgi:hypothetical protein